MADTSEYSPIPENGDGTSTTTAWWGGQVGPEFWTLGSLGPPLQRQRRSGQLWFLASEVLNPLALLRVLASSADPRRNPACVALYLAGALTTAMLAPTSVDWWWLKWNRPANPDWYSFARLELTIGMFVVPFAAPTTMYIWGLCCRNAARVRCGVRIGHAVVLAALVVTTLKVSLGRERPPNSLEPAPEEDTSNVWEPFSFSGSWGGHWPSGHTMSAWATVHAWVACSFGEAPAYRGLLPESALGVNIYRGCVGLGYCYAVVMAVAMGTTVHWLSDMAAGLCIGCALALASSRQPFAAGLGDRDGGDDDSGDWHARGLAAARHSVADADIAEKRGNEKSAQRSHKPRPLPKPRPRIPKPAVERRTSGGDVGLGGGANRTIL
jgi:membrane-associated phospholipid phosphatase